MSFPWPAWLAPEELIVVLDDPEGRLQTNGRTNGRLSVPRTADALAQLEVLNGDGPVAIRAPTPTGIARLAQLASRMGPVPVLAERRSRDEARIDLTLYLVPGYRRLEDPLRVGVNEVIAESVSRRLGEQLDAAAAAAWLTSELISPMPGKRGLLLGSHVDPGRDLEGGLQVHGRDATLHVTVRDGAFVIDRITPPAGRNARLEDTLQLIDGDIAFSEETYASRVAALHQAAVSAAAETPTSRYIQVWEQYEEESIRHILAQARRFGTLRYTHSDRRSSERWSLVLASPRDAERLVDGLGGSNDLAIYERRPAWMDADHTSSAVAQAMQRDQGALRVHLVDANVSDGVVTIRREDHDLDRPLPQAGLLALSLAGHRTQVKRRMVARQDLAAHPDLQLILADHNVDLPGAKRRRLPTPLPEAIKRSFGGREPNASQLEAIRLAYENGGLVAIQGPPGTGKTSVVAAIQQLYASDASAGARNMAVLVSAAQHDAVENVLAKSSVLGLPPIKHGRRSGEADGTDTRISDWARARARSVEQRLEQTEDGPLAEAILRLTRLGRSYLAVARPPRENARLLRTLAEASAPDGSRLLSPLLRDEITDAAGQLDREAQQTAASTSRRNAQLRAAAALIRTMPAGFADDGPQAADRARVLLQVAGHLPDDADDLLARAGEEPDVDFGALAELQHRILDETAASGSLSSRALRDTRTTSLVSMALEELEARLRATPSGRAQALLRYRDSLAEDIPGLEATLVRYLTVVGATTQQSATLDRLFDEKEDVEFRVVVVDEAARAQPLDLLIPLVRAQECKVLVGDHRQLPQLVDQDLVGKVSTTKGLDARALLEMSLFERLYQRLDRCNRAVTLDEQYRMHPRIGRFVSDTFYPEGERFRSPRPPEEFEHGLSVEGYAGRVVRWLDVPPSREARVGTSVTRPAEAQAVVTDLAKLLDDRSDLSFGLIAMYGAQVAECWKALEAHGLAERSGEAWQVKESYRYCRSADGDERTDEHGRWIHRLRVGTVDAFQGREFDVVFVSLVRSNRHSEPRRRFGYTLTPNRLNVALSRAKRLLVVAGDWSTFALDVADTEPVRAFHALCADDGGDG